jgi:plastocyanin
MQEPKKKISRRSASFAMAALLAGVAASPVSATEWRAWVGAQSPDLGSQALAFLPNELWIHAGDSIRWMHSSTAIHTVTFLRPGQTRPPNYGPVWGVPVGCPGNTPDGASFDGSSCVNSGILGQDPASGVVGPQTYSVAFPSPGNFKLVCLVHTDMTGTVHVLKQSESLPHDQTFYDKQAAKDGAAFVAEASSLKGLPKSGDGDEARLATVTAGISEILTTTGAGSQTVSLVRFLQPVIVVRVGDTVQWTNDDVSDAHTVTFGTEPADPRPPSLNVSPASDGAWQVVISSPNDSVNAPLRLAFQDRPNLAQSAVGVTRFRVTFTAPGTFNYICAIHDYLGMKGTVIVH